MFMIHVERSKMGQNMESESKIKHPISSNLGQNNYTTEQQQMMSSMNSLVCLLLSMAVNSLRNRHYQMRVFCPLGKITKPVHSC